MEHDFSIRSSFYSRRLRSITLVRIRWMAMACQLSTILFVYFFLQFDLPLQACLLLLAASLFINIFLTLHYSINHRLDPHVATTILACDIIILAALLYLTGGLQNPFSILLIVPAVISATSLPLHYIIILNLLVIGCATFLSFFYRSLPWYPGTVIFFPRLLIDGVWSAITVTLLFTSAYAYRVAEEARKLADALTATELVMQNEHHISALDGLAAAAAHELGTPLATIQLVVKEMQLSLKNIPQATDDIALLTSQTARCRDILKRITSLSSSDHQHWTQIKLTSLLEEVIAPHRDFGITITTEKTETTGDEPNFQRNNGILYGLGNLIENAVDFAKSRVTIRYGWDEKLVCIHIVDDGHGYPTAILERIGEPYISSRENNQQGGGLGLGLFIAKTLLERSGAQLRFHNSTEKHLGAEISLTWYQQKSML